jgi:cyclic pyranopterin phosphate synthase
MDADAQRSPHRRSGALFRRGGNRRRLGLITPLTNNFCDGCNRIRVTATGQLFACLGGNEQVDLRAALRSANPQAALDEALDVAMKIKPARHNFVIDARGQAPALARHMSMTGG